MSCRIAGFRREVLTGPSSAEALEVRNPYIGREARRLGGDTLFQQPAPQIGYAGRAPYAAGELHEPRLPNSRVHPASGTSKTCGAAWLMRVFSRRS
jgi:hypothetical protein